MKSQLDPEIRTLRNALHCSRIDVQRTARRGGARFLLRRLPPPYKIFPDRRATARQHTQIRDIIARGRGIVGELRVMVIRIRTEGRTMWFWSRPSKPRDLRATYQVLGYLAIQMLGENLLEPLETRTLHKALDSPLLNPSQDTERPGAPGTSVYSQEIGIATAPQDIGKSGTPLSSLESG